MVDFINVDIWSKRAVFKMINIFINLQLAIFASWFLSCFWGIYEDYLKVYLQISGFLALVLTKYFHKFAVTSYVSWFLSCFWGIYDYLKVYLQNSGFLALVLFNPLVNIITHRCFNSLITLKSKYHSSLNFF